MDICGDIMNILIGILACVGTYMLLSYALFAVEGDVDDTEDETDREGA